MCPETLHHIVYIDSRDKSRMFKWKLLNEWGWFPEQCCPFIFLARPQIAHILETQSGRWAIFSACLWMAYGSCIFHTSPAEETRLHPVTHSISQSCKDTVYSPLKVIIGMNAWFLKSWNQICVRIPKVNYWGDKQSSPSQGLSALFQENSDSVSQLWRIWFLPRCREQLPRSVQL